ncbi:protein phosphatase 2C 37-like [Euphorbia lathyris]|uniref:protein phosphatase 2C 37-like n=1 Tax=Euphorbia lathyris TaxID=212925 RepID=UPI003313A81F
MDGICYGVVGESETAAPVVEPSSRASRRRRLELRPFKVVADSAVQPPSENGRKRQKIDLFPLLLDPLARDCNNAEENCKSSEDMCRGSKRIETKTPETNETLDSKHQSGTGSSVSAKSDRILVEESPKYGMTLVYGRRRDMEDVVSIQMISVALKCKDQLHDILKEEIESSEEIESVEWKGTMERTFAKMDKEAEKRCNDEEAKCRCDLQTP